MDYKKMAKSKSSNVAIASKSEKKQNKKSSSNAEFQPFVMKKRGMYVEKKIHSLTNTKEATAVEVKRQPPPRPRAGQKKFLSSVLTILSKSTTGTQYPDHDDVTMAKARFKSRWKPNDTDRPSKTGQRMSKTKKSKFRSRVLNEEMLRAEREQLIVLQSKKDIAQTPSNYSARSKAATESIKWSDVLQKTELPKRSPIRDILENNIYSGVAEGITKEVLEGKVNDDPVTLASEIAKRDDKKLYNFFVDLLKTTISVYNVKADYEPSDASKIVLEINESIAKKLQFKNGVQSHNDIPKCNRTCKIEEDLDETRNDIPIDIKLSDYKPPASVRPKVKAKSFFCPYPVNRKSCPKSNSFDSSKRNVKLPKRKTLLNILKEQLEMDTVTFEEPESLYDALKVMAKNKKRCEKSIRFDKTLHDKMNNDYDTECMFRRRKVISFKSKKKIKPKTTTTNELRNNRQSYGDEANYKRYFPSYHSLEVYGYDYEEPAKRPEEKQERRVIFTYHSTPSASEANLHDYNTLINYPDSSTSSNYSFYNR